MSVMQALQLLKFVKGITKIWTRNQLDTTYETRWKWLIQVNEGGKPLNFTIGQYQPRYKELEGHGSKFFFHIYFLGYRWYTK